MTQSPDDELAGLLSDLDAETRVIRLLEIDLLCLTAEEPGKWDCNNDVYMAVGNKRPDAAEKIIALLRSNEEIHPLVREALAQAFADGLTGDKTENVRLIVKGAASAAMEPK